MDLRGARITDKTYELLAQLHSSNRPTGHLPCRVYGMSDGRVKSAAVRIFVFLSACFPVISAKSYFLLERGLPRSGTEEILATIVSTTTRFHSTFPFVHFPTCNRQSSQSISSSSLILITFDHPLAKNLLDMHFFPEQRCQVYLSAEVSYKNRRKNGEVKTLSYSVRSTVVNGSVVCRRAWDICS
ncbi:hypothetical protein VTL71DRAFT_1753 [Oculimacula yallundae]|uniref:Uncharacterized protein n=1 Tax=Oculimacula yallundae TaxID=86028 RepID=A0ABR4CDZ9_9HELO